MKIIEEYINKYYEISKFIFNNYDEKKTNYYYLNNIHKFFNYIDCIILDIKKIIRTNNNGEIANIHHKIISLNEILLIYNINNYDKKIRIFGEEFVKNNKNNFKIVYEDEEKKLTEFFKTNKKFRKKYDYLKIRLREIKSSTNISQIFRNCCFIF